MRYWQIVAAVAVAILAAATWLLQRAVKRNRPYLFGRAFAANALGRLADVRGGTEIDIVGCSLGFLARQPSWGKLLRKWLKKGAVIRYVVHSRDGDGDGDGESAFRKLAERYGNSLKLFVVATDARESEIVRDAEDFHFVVFRGPDQLWLEGTHPRGQPCARDCEYVPRASLDERWKPRREDFAALMKKSEEVGLGEAED